MQQEECVISEQIAQFLSEVCVCGGLFTVILLL